MYRLFAAEHVYREVTDHLDRVIAESGRDVALAEKIWTAEYLPRIRFVSIDAAQLSVFDARIASVLQRDPDDAPAAALAVVLGTRVLSEDSDLRDPGLATGRPWLQFVTASKDVTVGQTANFGLALTTTLSANFVGALGKRSMLLTRSVPGRLSMLMCMSVICAIAVFLARNEPARRRTKGAIESAWERTAPVLSLALTAYSQAMLNQSAGQATLTWAALHAPEQLQEIAVAARILAAGSAPMSSTEIATRMWAYQRVPGRAVDHVEALLHSSSVFVQAPGLRWQLGRLSAPAI
jgi:hypothetical protein